MSFDKQAKEWDLNPMKVERAKTFANEILTAIQPSKNMNAMEFGCGTALLSFYLKNHFKTILAIDSSTGMIDVVKEKINETKTTNIIPKLVSESATILTEVPVDVIATLMTLHHMIDLHHAINLFSSSLAANGYLCIADLVEEDGSFHANIDGFDGHNGFNKEHLVSLLEEHQFTTVHYSTPFKIEKEVNGIQKVFPLFLLIAQKTN